MLSFHRRRNTKTVFEQSLEIIEGLLHLSSVDGRQVTDNDPYWVTLKAIIAVMAQSGFRKDEVACSSWDLSRPSRAHLQWRIGGRVFANPSKRKLRQMAEGDCAILTPPPSKADKFGILWASKAIFLPFHLGVTINAAYALRSMVLLAPCATEDLASTPLFVNPRTSTAFKPAHLDKILPKMLVSAGVPLVACKQYSWHSFRIYLCTALFNAGVGDSVIQAMLRWATPESANEYKRFSQQSYDYHLTLALRTPVFTVRAHNLPIIDPGQSAYDLAMAALPTRLRAA